MIIKVVVLVVLFSFRWRIIRKRRNENYECFFENLYEELKSFYGYFERIFFFF